MRLSPARAEPAFTSAEVRETPSFLVHADDLAQFLMCLKAAALRQAACGQRRFAGRRAGQRFDDHFLQAPNLDARWPTPPPCRASSLRPAPSRPSRPRRRFIAPFGAHYGYGGANLIPDTPTPDPADITPVPTAAPTDTPAPTAVPNRTLKKNSTGEDESSSRR